MYSIRVSVAFILLALTALALTPMTIIRPFHRNNMGDICTVVTKVMGWYWGVKFEYENGERLTATSPTIFIANHQDTQDMFFGEALIRPGTVSLGKWEVLYIPFIGLLYFLAGNIVIKRANKEKAQKALSIAAEKMNKKDLSVLIFPEGTRNWGKPLPFKLGAFKLAIEAGVPIQPICVSLRHKTMDYGQFRSGVVKIKCLDPISTEGLTQDDAVELAVQCRKLIESECIELTKSVPGYDENQTEAKK